MKKIALIYGITGQDGAYLAKFLLKFLHNKFYRAVNYHLTSNAAVTLSFSVCLHKVTTAFAIINNELNYIIKFQLSLLTYLRK